ncbi:DNA repair protein, ATPase [Paracholeplasma brassicae]|uniref:DNA repair protein RecN n=1 Tax=Acholeplasma brassicae TaxID=61635 RepID=U4KT63_9MOLU|nr:DNA repair protein RecN [Paracholeplasma brassicae]CCV66139.1 DNA repair protein, ATPase [Paracholeplasma brassicae]
MLKTLKIENLAIIEDLNLEFEPGMTALTGQTGAGKSLLIDSLKLLFGARADQDLIRFQKSQATIVGVFTNLGTKLKQILENYQIKSEELVIKRIMSRDNKNQIQINQTTITLQDLRKIAFYLGDIHEQHDVSKLLDQNLQLSLIDQIDRLEVEPLINDFVIAKESYLSAKKKYTQALEKKAVKEKEIKALKEEIDELEKAKLDAEELTTLNETIEKLENQEKIVSSVSNAYEILEDMYQKQSLYDAAMSLKKVKDYDVIYEKAVDTILNSHYELEALRDELSQSLEVFSFHSSEYLNELQERDFFLKNLEKNYNKTINELIVYLKSIKEEVLMIEDYDGYVLNLKKDQDRLFKETLDLGIKLREKREKLSKRLEHEIITELKLLDLEKVRFQIAFDEQMDNFFEDGIDLVTFLISLNEGEPLRALYKTASGGELSRFMLALKIVFSRHQRINLVVFDEIDMGISGVAASKVAHRMKELSKDIQVLSITHLAQVAAIANNHYSITKVVKEGRTFTEVSNLETESRVRAIAEMLSGERISSYAIEHAKALLEK